MNKTLQFKKVSQEENNNLKKIRRDIMKYNAKAN